MHAAFFAGDWTTRASYTLRTLPITQAMFSIPNPVPIKTALAMIGVLSSSVVRLPLVAANEREQSTIRAALIKYGLPVFDRSTHIEIKSRL